MAAAVFQVWLQKFEIFCYFQPNVFWGVAWKLSLVDKKKKSYCKMNILCIWKHAKYTVTTRLLHFKLFLIKEVLYFLSRKTKMKTSSGGFFWVTTFVFKKVTFFFIIILKSWNLFYIIHISFISISKYVLLVLFSNIFPISRISFQYKFSFEKSKKKQRNIHPRLFPSRVFVTCWTMLLSS